MKDGSHKPLRLEALLAGVLHYGTVVASVIVGVGLVLALIDSHFGTRNLAVVPNLSIVTAGIVFFILLPVLRVLLMLVVFLRGRDYRFAAVAALVLTIILLAFAVGTHLPSKIAG